MANTNKSTSPVPSNRNKKPRKPRVQKPITEAHKAQIKSIRIDAPHGHQYANGHGRPTEFKPEFAQAMLDYFRNIKPDCLEEGEDAQGNTKIIAVDFVSFEDFADTIDVSYRSLYNWYTAVNEDGTPKHPEFFSAYEQCKTIQSGLVLRGGMTGAYKGGFATLAAMNIMGWKTQAETQTEHIVAAGMAETITKLTEQNRRKAQSMMENMQRERESD